MHDPNSRFGEVVDQPCEEISQPEPAFLRILANRAEDLSVARQQNEGEQNDPYPPQVDVHLDIAVMSFVWVPPVEAPEIVQSGWEPETFKAGT